uniref:cystatin-like isoform X2 n=1 Tax=Pristiophorus japonicus TaxID=55135 RepID=UPI00398ED1B4
MKSSQFPRTFPIHLLPRSVGPSPAMIHKGSTVPLHSVKEIEKLSQNTADKPLVLKVDTGDNDFRAIAEFALQDYSIRNGYIYKIMQYLTAKVQVVEGSIYIFDVFMGKTTCQSTKSGQQAENCHLILAPGQSEFYLCHFIVWHLPSPAKQHVLSSKCQKFTA